MGDLRQFIPVMIIGSGLVVLGLSYVAAYLIGKDHGRREAERTSALNDPYESDSRIAQLESAMGSITNSVERLRDAQKLLVAQQEHLGKKVGLGSHQKATTPS